LTDPERGEKAAAFGDADTVEALEALYLRPDIRAAVIQIAPALVELLSRDEEAARALWERFGTASEDAGGSERFYLASLPFYLWGSRLGQWLAE